MSPDGEPERGLKPARDVQYGRIQNDVAEHDRLIRLFHYSQQDLEMRASRRADRDLDATPVFVAQEQTRTSAPSNDRNSVRS